MTENISHHPSDSYVQQDAEEFMLKALEKRLNIQFLKSAKLPIDITVKPDAIDPINKVIVEAYSRVGKVKGAQLHKIKGDILKLALIGQKLGISWRKIMCFASEEAASYVKGQSWVAEAAKTFNVEVQIISLPSEQKNKVMTAQKRQQMVNVTDK